MSILKSPFGQSQTYIFKQEQNLCKCACPYTKGLVQSWKHKELNAKHEKYASIKIFLITLDLLLSLFWIAVLSLRSFQKNEQLKCTALQWFGKNVVNFLSRQ